MMAGALPGQEIAMLAERAVQQGVNDLRGEIGVKFQEIENGVQDLKSELEKANEDLGDKMTDAFKANNARSP